MTSLIQRFARTPGDPEIIRSGPNEVPVSDRVAKGLGWFSLALGTVQIFALSLITRALGMEGRETLMRAYGVREVAAGVTSLSTDKSLGLWSRVGGDVLDIATLSSAYTDDNPKKGNVGLALAIVVGITCLDLATAGRTTAVHSRPRRGPPRDYGDRSGWPQGLAAARAGRPATLPAVDAA